MVDISFFHNFSFLSLSSFFSLSYHKKIGQVRNCQTKTKTEKGKTKRKIGYKNKWLRTRITILESKQEDTTTPPKKKKMSNFNNIWEEIRKPSEEPDRLTLVRDLQSHIKQVVGDTPEARSTLTSSIGYTFGPMVKLGIQSGVELQSEKRCPYRQIHHSFNKILQEEEKKKTTTLTLQIQLGKFIATFENLQLPAVKEALNNRPKCPFTFMHQSFHYFLAMHIYTFQKDVLLEAYFREEDENGKFINLKKIFSFRHKRFFRELGRDYFKVVQFKEGSPLRRYLALRLPQCFREDTSETTCFQLIQAIYAIIDNGHFYDPQNPRLIICNDKLEEALGTSVLDITDLMTYITKQLNSANLNCHQGPSPCAEKQFCQCKYFMPNGTFAISDYYNNSVVNTISSLQPAVNAMQASFTISSLPWNHYTALMNQAKRAEALKNPSFDENSMYRISTFMLGIIRSIPGLSEEDAQRNTFRFRRLYFLVLAFLDLNKDILVDRRAPEIYRLFKIPALKQALGGMALMKTHQLEPLLKFLVQPVETERRDTPLVPFFLPSSYFLHPVSFTPPSARRTEDQSTPLAVQLPRTPNTDNISPYTSPGISPPPSDEEDSGIEDCQAEAVAYDPETFQGRTPKRRKLPAARRLRF